jgi:MFS family permease
MRGRYQGLFSMVWGLAMALSPVFGGQMMHHLGAPALWFACLAISALIALGHLVCASSRRKQIAVVLPSRLIDRAAAS